MEGHVVSELLLYRIGFTGDNDNYDKNNIINNNNNNNN